MNPQIKPKSCDVLGFPPEEKHSNSDLLRYHFTGEATNQAQSVMNSKLVNFYEHTIFQYICDINVINLMV